MKGYKILNVVGGTASLITTLLLVAALIPVESIFQDNFLVLIFKLHAGFSSVHEETLKGLNFLDISILVLVGTVATALFPILRQVNKAWAITAVALPFIGFGLYVITQDIGRSGILASGLIISAMMVKNNFFSKKTSYLGVLASVCLLVADIGIAISYARIFAITIGIGYISITLWYGMISWKLIQFGKS